MSGCVSSPPLSYTHGADSEPLLGLTIGDNLRATVERHPEQTALVVRHQGYRASYRELWDATTTLAKALIARGVAKGDRVGVWAPNRFEWVVAQYATARVGAIMVNVNPAYKARELDYALRQSGLGVLLLARGFRTTSYVDLLASVLADAPELARQLEQVVVLDRDWDALLAAASETSDAALAAREAALSFDDPINIQYTSGTTGAPKGATLSHHNILNNAYMIARILGYGVDDRVCVPVPFYHCFGMVIGNLACTSTGATIVVPGESFDPEATLAAVAAERCTSLYGVPTMFIAQLAHPRFDDYDLSSLRTGVMAGSLCPEPVMTEVIERMHMRDVTICYGMTETSPVSTQTRTDAPFAKRVATVGRVHPHVEIKIVDDEGRTVPRGVQGELCTRGYSVMLGYWNDADATARAIDAGRWMHTGDLATMDAEGYLRITGRIKDMIIRGGENVYPREVEDHLYDHAAIVDAQVFGVPSQKYGEEVAAWIRLGAGEQLSAEDVVAYCRGQIATFKIPTHVRFVDEFPMTVTGKIQKYRMREAMIAELGLGELEGVASIGTGPTQD